MFNKYKINNININNFYVVFFYAIYLYLNFSLALLVFSLLIFVIPLITLGKEINKSHGIEVQNKSRLGGLIILITLLIFFFNNTLDLNNLLFESINFFFIVFFAISLLGLVDDLFGKLGHLIRLYFNIFAIFILLYTNNVFLFFNTDIDFINYIFQYKYLSYFITIFIIVGFINASNISDGANGILSGISSVAFLIFYLESSDLIYLKLFEVILFFFIYNIFVGNVYLGDAGSYLLGFLISTVSLYLYNINIIPAGLLACILCYPSIEVLMTIIRRFSKLQNPFLPDNFHLHNLIHHKYNKSKFKNYNTNSLTGITILSLFSFPSLILYLFLPEKLFSLFWVLFLAQTAIYIFIYRYLKY